MPENNEHNNQFDLPNNSNNGIELPKVNTNGENKHSVNDFNANNSFNNNDSVNNNPFSNQNNSNLNEEEKKPIIEIPKAYYDKLAQEQQEKMEQENQLKQMKAETGEALNETGKFLSLALINGIIIFGLFYLTLNKFKYSLIGIPIYIVILTFYYAKKEGIKTSFPSALMFGGMMCSIVTFIMSMIQEEKGNIWMYYTIASISTAFLGMIISNIITKLITDIKNVKALQGIGYILFFAILIGAPFYLLKNYRDVIYRYLFFEQVAPVAETETDFVLKTLKNR